MPVPATVIRLCADYLHGEYSELDSDYVFVNLWSGPIGCPLTYASVYDLVCRLRERTGIAFGPHIFATRMPQNCCAATYRWRWCSTYWVWRRGCRHGRVSRGPLSRRR